MQSKQNMLVGIDIGSSGVRVVTAVPANEDSAAYSVAGVGLAPCLGVRKGVIVHPDEVANAVNAAVEDAERQAGFPVRHATVNINGSHVASQSSRGVVAISGAGRVITEDDRLRVEEAATVVQMPTNREITQVFAKNYRVDGDEPVKDPVGMQGVRLEVDTQIISAATPALKALDLVFERSGVEVASHVVAGLAAAEAVLDRRQKESGTAVIDIGAGTTNIAILEEGEIEHIAVIPIGGQHLTNDLAIGLKTELEIAEKVKVHFASLNSQARRGVVKVDHSGDSHQFDADMITMIVEARMEELMEYIDREFAKVKRSKKLPGGVVFVGGSAHLKGLSEFAKAKLSLPAKVGQVRGVTGLLDKVKGPEMATPVGLMMLDNLFAAHTAHNQSGWLKDNLFTRRLKKLSRH